MKLNCDVIQDLLPLYEEGLCSEASRKLVEAHLAGCDRCRNQLAAAEKIEQPPLPELSDQDTAVRSSFRKVRRRWWASLMAALLVVPVLWLSVNQYRRQGLCFTNIDDLLRAGRYSLALEQADWERAAALMDYDSLYDEIQEILSWDLDHYIQEAGENEDPQYHYDFNRNYYAEARDMTREEFTEYVRSHYVADLKLLEEHGYTFRVTGFEGAYYGKENGGWTICYGVRMEKDGYSQQLSLHLLVRERGLYLGAIGHPGELLGFGQEEPEVLPEEIDLAEILFMGYPDE